MVILRFLFITNLLSRGSLGKHSPSKFLPLVAVFHVLRWKTRTAERGPPPAITFPQDAKFASFSPFFFALQSANSCENAAQTLRKNRRTILCAKDAEKARKICGFACGYPARKRWRSSEEAAENRSRSCGSNLMTERILKFVFVFSGSYDFTLFWPALDRGFYWA